MTTDDLHAASIAQAIGETCALSILGHPTYYWASLPSTMDEVRRLAEMGATEGTTVVADEQTAGRGRLERTWWAPPGSSLLLSILLRPGLLPRQAQRLTMVCSLAVCDAIAEICGVLAQVKWPNDVLIQGRKVCGILTELDIVDQRLGYAIVGIGINVNLDFCDAPPLMAPATSLLRAAGHPVSRLDLLIALLTGIERRYVALREGLSCHREWAERLATLGHEVQVRGPAQTWQGLAIDVDEDGSLLVRGKDGGVHRVLAGDVTLHAE
jgi:BirA family biotin operon repressor/biotin-[acetyl-CoA-carboxylase] ligase